MKSSRLQKALEKVATVTCEKSTETSRHWKANREEKFISWVEKFGDEIVGMPHAYTQAQKNKEEQGFFFRTIEEMVKWIK